MANLTFGPCKKCKEVSKYEFMFFCEKCYRKEMKEIKSTNRLWTKKTTQELEL